MQHAAAPAERERRAVAAGLDAVAGGLDADQRDLGVLDERHEHADRVGAAADAGDHALGQPPGLVEDLRAGLVADHALQVAHERRERRRADARADDVVRVADVRDPVADRRRDRLLERPRPRLDRLDARAEQAPCAARWAAGGACPRCPCRRCTRGRAARTPSRVATPCWPAPVSAMMRVLPMRRASSAWPSALLILCAPVWSRSSRLSQTGRPDRLGEPRAPRRAASGGRRSRAAGARGRPGSRRRRGPAPTPPRARRAPASASRGRTGPRRGRSGARRRSCDRRLARRRPRRSRGSGGPSRGP